MVLLLQLRDIVLLLYVSFSFYPLFCMVLTYTPSLRKQNLIFEIKTCRHPSLVASEVVDSYEVSCLNPKDKKKTDDSSRLVGCGRYSIELIMCMKQP